MTGYKTIITCNVSADSLNQDFLNSLESYVKDFGGDLSLQVEIILLPLVDTLAHL